VGCLLYLGFFAGIGWKAWRLTRPSDQTEDSFSALVILLGLISLGAGVLTNPLFDHGVETLLWFLAGMVSSLDRRRIMVSPPTAQSPSPARLPVATVTPVR